MPAPPVMPVVAVHAIDDVVAIAAAQIVGGIAAGDAVVAVAAIDRTEMRDVGQAAEVEDVAGPGADHAGIIAVPGLDRGRAGIEAGKGHSVGASHLDGVSSGHRRASHRWSHRFRR